jgi:hypothetical protein
MNYIVYSIEETRERIIQSKEYRKWAKANGVSSRVEGDSIEEYKERYIQWLNS